MEVGYCILNRRRGGACATMDVVAMAMLLTALGSVMMLSSEIPVVKSSKHDESPSQSVKVAANVMIFKVEEKEVTKPVGKLTGWFRKKPKSEDHLAVAREKAALAKEAIQEAEAQIEDAEAERSSFPAESILEMAAETGKYLGDRASKAADAAMKIVGTAQTMAEDSASAMHNKAVSVKDSTYDAVAAARETAESALRRTETSAKEVAEEIHNRASEALESAKDKTYEKIGVVGNTIHDGTECVKEKLHDVVEGVKDGVYEVGLAAKESTSGAADYAKDKVYKGVQSVHRTRDAVIDSVLSRVEKTTNIATDATGKIKKTADHATQEVKDAGRGILNKMKDAVCMTADCIQARAREAGSVLPNLRQGIGYLHNERKETTGKIAESGKEAMSQAAENLEEIGESIRSYAKDGIHSAMSSSRRSYDAVKDQARNLYESVKDTTRDDFDEAGLPFGNARHYYDRFSQSYQNVREVPLGSYPNAAKEEVADFYDNFRDKTQNAYRVGKDRAGEFYDFIRGRTDVHRHERPEDWRSRDYFPAMRRRAAVYYRSERDTAKDCYEISKFNACNDLTTVIESMGWRSTGILSPENVPTSSPSEIVIGNVKYAWQGTGRQSGREYIFNSVPNTADDATNIVSERLGITNEPSREGGENVRDTRLRAKDQADETFSTPRDRRGRHSGTNQSGDREHDEDSVVSRGAQNQRDRMRNAEHASEFPRSAGGNYADNTQEELSNFTRFSDKSKFEYKTWKDFVLGRSTKMLRALSRALHLFTFSILYGSSFWVTFVSGMLLSKHLSRQQFGYVQSHMFAVYLRIVVVGHIVLFCLHSIMHPWFSADKVELWQLLNSVLMIASTITNAFVLEPRATNMMFEQLQVEKEERRIMDNTVSPREATQFMEDSKKKLTWINNRLKTFHSYLSLFNLIGLSSLTCHLWYLAHRLVV